MNIIYIHHANRQICNNNPTENDDITEIGEEDAKLVGKLLDIAQSKNANIKAIYSSSFYRCTKTANIINANLHLPIIIDDRLNEIGKDEDWLSLQNRTRSCIIDITQKYTESDSVICVTSGANIASFISLANKQEPSKDTAIIGVPACCPLIFKIDKSCY